jgi:hypothetical protein
MKLELKENMYYRTYSGSINKITSIKDYNEREYLLNGFYINKDTIKKASYNIIDLIELKDIILGRDGKMYQCWKIYKDYVFTYSKNKQGQTITLVDYQIDKVLTKEQFEQMAYRVGE